MIGDRQVRYRLQQIGRGGLFRCGMLPYCSYTLRDSDMTQSTHLVIRMLEQQGLIRWESTNPTNLGCLTAVARLTKAGVARTKGSA